MMNEDRDNNTNMLDNYKVYIKQLKLLLYKNLILKKRNRRLTVAELLFPLYFVIIIIILYKSVKPIVISNPEVPFYPSVDIPKLSLLQLIYQGSFAFAYVADPTDVYHSSIISHILTTNNITTNYTKSFTSEEDLVSYYNSNPGKIWGAIVLDTITESTIGYSIRINDSYTSSYLFDGYATLQQNVLAAFLNLNNANFSWQLSATEFPTPSYYSRINVFSFIEPIYFPMVFQYSLSQLVVLVVTEKEKKLKEGMKMMGMKSPPYWLSWYLTQMAISIVGILIFCLAGYLGGLFAHSNIFLIFLFFALYSSALIFFGFLISVFMNKPKVASAIAWLIVLVDMGIFEICHFFLYNKQQNGEFKGSNTLYEFLRVITSFVFVVPLGEFSQSLSDAEFAGVGLHFDSQSMNNPSSYPVRYSFGAIILDNIIYGILVWYIGNVYVGEYGVRKPYLFFLDSSYWVESSFDDKSLSTHLLAFRPEGDVGIEVTRLYKEFEDLNAKKSLKSHFGSLKNDKSKKVIAVNNLSMSVLKGEIYALLGRNGSGKTTTISMMTGLFPSTAGSISVLGFDVDKNMDEIRQRIGVCPQHNILFDQLTCYEHLKLYAGIKGIPDEEVEAMIPQRIEEVGLREHLNTLSKDLSGGTKRKLSIAIAFLGNSEVVFLDECTAGIDPYGRRLIWQLLQKYKAQGRTIVLTTHFLEEAELLGDRIAIISKGQMKCVGTSMELKHNYNLGYIIKFVRHYPTEENDLLHQLIAQNFKSFKLIQSTSPLEVCYHIAASEVSKFSDFFTKVEQKMNEEKDNIDDINGVVTNSINVSSYGVSVSTLEDVFLAIADEEDELDPEHVSIN